MKTLLRALSLPLFLFAACQGPNSQEPNGGTDPQSSVGTIKIAQAGAAKGQINFRDPLYRRFTDRFEEPAMLLADRIEVHGPSDLLEHLALRQDSEGFELSTKTTPEGLRQELTRKPQVLGGEAFAQLDKWQLFALHKLIVVQAPDDQPVRIVAFGQAVYLPKGEGEQELKQERITFTGQHGNQ